VFLERRRGLKLGHCEASISPGERGVEVNRLLEVPLRNLVIICRSLGQMPQAALVSRPGVKVRGLFAHRASEFGIGDGRGDSNSDGSGYLVLQSKDVGEVAVVALGPHMLAGLGLDQLMRLPNLRRLPSST
jgi:hypothetical protein